MGWQDVYRKYDENGNVIDEIRFNEGSPEYEEAKKARESGGGQVGDWYIKGGTGDIRKKTNVFDEATRLAEFYTPTIKVNDAGNGLVITGPSTAIDNDMTKQLQSYLDDTFKYADLKSANVADAIEKLNQDVYSQIEQRITDSMLKVPYEDYKEYKEVMQQFQGTNPLKSTGAVPGYLKNGRKVSATDDDNKTIAEWLKYYEEHYNAKERAELFMKSMEALMTGDTDFAKYTPYLVMSGGSGSTPVYGFNAGERAAAGIETIYNETAGKLFEGGAQIAMQLANPFSWQGYGRRNNLNEIAHELGHSEDVDPDEVKWMSEDEFNKKRDSLVGKNIDELTSDEQAFLAALTGDKLTGYFFGAGRPSPKNFLTEEGDSKIIDANQINQFSYEDYINARDNLSTISKYSKETTEGVETPFKGIREDIDVASLYAPIQVGAGTFIGTMIRFWIESGLISLATGGSFIPAALSDSFAEGISKILTKSGLVTNPENLSKGIGNFLLRVAAEIPEDVVQTAIDDVLTGHVDEIGTLFTPDSIADNTMQNLVMRLAFTPVSAGWQWLKSKKAIQDAARAAGMEEKVPDSLFDNSRKVQQAADGVEGAGTIVDATKNSATIRYPDGHEEVLDNVAMLHFADGNMAERYEPVYEILRKKGLLEEKELDPEIEEILTDKEKAVKRLVENREPIDPKKMGDAFPIAKYFEDFDAKRIEDPDQVNSIIDNAIHWRIQDGYYGEDGTIRRPWEGRELMAAMALRNPELREAALNKAYNIYIKNHPEAQQLSFEQWLDTPITLTRRFFTGETVGNEDANVLGYSMKEGGLSPEKHGDQLSEITITPRQTTGMLMGANEKYAGEEEILIPTALVKGHAKYLDIDKINDIKNEEAAATMTEAPSSGSYRWESPDVTKTYTSEEEVFADRPVGKNMAEIKQWQKNAEAFYMNKYRNETAPKFAEKYPTVDEQQQFVRNMDYLFDLQRKNGETLEIKYKAKTADNASPSETLEHGSPEWHKANRDDYKKNGKTAIQNKIKGTRYGESDSLHNSDRVNYITSRYKESIAENRLLQIGEDLYHAESLLKYATNLSPEEKAALKEAIDEMEGYLKDNGYEVRRTEVGARKSDEYDLLAYAEGTENLDYKSPTYHEYVSKITGYSIYKGDDPVVKGRVTVNAVGTPEGTKPSGISGSQSPSSEADVYIGQDAPSAEKTVTASTTPEELEISGSVIGKTYENEGITYTVNEDDIRFYLDNIEPIMTGLRKAGAAGIGKEEFTITGYLPHSDYDPTILTAEDSMQQGVLWREYSGASTTAEDGSFSTGWLNPDLEARYRTFVNNMLWDSLGDEVVIAKFMEELHADGIDVEPQKVIDLVGGRKNLAKIVSKSDSAKAVIKGIVGDGEIPTDAEIDGTASKLGTTDAVHAIYNPVYGSAEGLNQRGNVALMSKSDWMRSLTTGDGSLYDNGGAMIVNGAADAKYLAKQIFDAIKNGEQIDTHALFVEYLTQNHRRTNNGASFIADRWMDKIAQKCQNGGITRRELIAELSHLIYGEGVNRLFRFVGRMDTSKLNSSNRKALDSLIFRHSMLSKVMNTSGITARINKAANGLISARMKSLFWLNYKNGVLQASECIRLFTEFRLGDAAKTIKRLATDADFRAEVDEWVDMLVPERFVKSDSSASVGALDTIMDNSTYKDGEFTVNKMSAASMKKIGKDFDTFASSPVEMGEALKNRVLIAGILEEADRKGLSGNERFAYVNRRFERIGLAANEMGRLNAADNPFFRIAANLKTFQIRQFRMFINNINDLNGPKEKTTYIIKNLGWKAGLAVILAKLGYSAAATLGIDPFDLMDDDYTGVDEENYTGLDYVMLSPAAKLFLSGGFTGYINDLYWAGRKAYEDNAEITDQTESRVDKEFWPGWVAPGTSFDNALNTLGGFIPGYTAGKRVVQMNELLDTGWATSASGTKMYEAPTNPVDIATGYLFGRSNTPNARAYYQTPDYLQGLMSGGIAGLGQQIGREISGNFRQFDPIDRENYSDWFNGTAFDEQQWQSGYYYFLNKVQDMQNEYQQSLQSFTTDEQKSALQDSFNQRMQEIETQLEKFTNAYESKHPEGIDQKKMKNLINILNLYQPVMTDTEEQASERSLDAYGQALYRYSQAGLPAVTSYKRTDDGVEEVYSPQLRSALQGEFGLPEEAAAQIRKLYKDKWKDLGQQYRDRLFATKGTKAKQAIQNEYIDIVRQDLDPIVRNYGVNIFSNEDVENIIDDVFNSMIPKYGQSAKSYLKNLYKDWSGTVRYTERGNQTLTQINKLLDEGKTAQAKSLARSLLQRVQENRTSLTRAELERLQKILND